MSEAEEEFAQQVRFAGLPEPQREYRFDPIRRWRFDFAWAADKLAVEIEGGSWTGGRHTRGPGFIHDCEKYNAALMCGWRVLRYTGGMVKDGKALADVTALMERRYTV